MANLFCGVAFLTSAAGAEQKLTLATFPSVGKNAGIIWALAEKRYQEAGIDFRLYDTRTNTLAVLGSNQVQIAQILCSSMAQFMGSERSPFVVIGVRDQINPVATVSLKSNPIATLDDMLNKKWGLSATFSPEQHILDVVFSGQGLDFQTIRKINLDYTVRTLALLGGDVDYISGWIGSGLPVVLSTIENAGEKASVMNWSDQGIDMYGECFVAKREFAEENKDLLGRWLEETKNGFEMVFEEPELGLSAVLEYYADGKYGSPAIVREQILQANTLVKRSDGSVFDFSEDRFANTVRLSGLPDITIMDVRDIYFGFEYGNRRNE